MFEQTRYYIPNTGYKVLVTVERHEVRISVLDDGTSSPDKWETERLTPKEWYGLEKGHWKRLD